MLSNDTPHDSTSMLTIFKVMDKIFNLEIMAMTLKNFKF